jgi:hypothetical protein
MLQLILVEMLTLGVFTVRFGSVRFRPKKPTEPNYSIVVKNEPNRTGTGSVKSGFLRKKPGNLIPWVFFVFFFKIGLRFGKI